MIIENRKYFGKLLLFGEYSMIYGSEALLMPFYSASGEWSSIMNRPSEYGIESNKKLFEFYKYLHANDAFRILDLRRFEMELNAGLYFYSNIPSGYGIGSSGALVAAIYERFRLIEINDITRLQSLFAKMESYFHGSSSGIDPMQSYYGKPFVLSQKQTENGKQSSLRLLDDDFISENVHIFLIDTKIKSKTAPLVEHFKEMRKNDNYLEHFNNEYVPVVNDCINLMIQKNDRGFFEKIGVLSDLQIDMLGHCIPDSMKELFKAKMSDNHFQVKICGSGGGGYILGFSDDREKTEDYFKENKLQLIWIN